MLLAAGFVALSLTACGGSATVPKLTFPQAVSLVCIDGNAAFDIMKTDGMFTGGALNTFDTQVSPDFNKVCAASTTVTTANLLNLTSAMAPAIKAIVNSSSASQQFKSDANTAVDVFLLAFNVAVPLVPDATANAASPASAASARVAASSAQ
ncbi:hypothetical protein [Paraburkholderia sp.]|uniref:hypothetical protein n=1 Tax=Paraburkholderia sp. TaxID=1926495 RepID=UPI0025ECA281|nr:hypothetical protein [Paraburkholderia sp.]